MSSFNKNTKDILNRQPKIVFVEPAPEIVLKPTQPTTQPEIEESKIQIQDVTQQYTRISQLADLAQQRIDSRAKDVSVCLHPTTDTAVLHSLKRQFGTTDGCISYQQYKDCLNRINAAGKAAAPAITAADLTAAATDIFKKNFGGLGSAPGDLRPEITIKSPVEPIDMDTFQKQSLIKLFEMLLPMIDKFSNFKLLAHTFEFPAHFNS